MSNVFRMHDYIHAKRARLAELLLAESIRHRRVVRLALDLASLTKQPLEAVLDLGRLDAEALAVRIGAESQRPTERIAR